MGNSKLFPELNMFLVVFILIFSFFHIGSSCI